QSDARIATGVACLERGFARADENAVAFTANPHGNALRRAVRHQGREVDKVGAVQQLLDFVLQRNSHVEPPAKKMSPERTRIQSFARSMLMMSSEVITPVSRLASSTTGRVIRLYLSNSSATSFSSAPAWVEMSGSCVRDSRGAVGWARTILESGTAPARVPCESTR